ncbi:inositol monophosphatase family protein [Celeribacter baekdonensis]|jgi:histidinol phosphatase-like enzyme (inositol monophosphatase family)|uniref:Histidinol-phosphatase n=1 Tax=Celeribacter baekdonensis TaxID=875171 RepID=A0A2R4LZX5_9RHOB|nr:inositol monophosphatase family protein [Celeribacter baekdonensis]AVW90382.1 histidinol-phosphatase [Celeribacter baekdonensis]
MSDATAKLGQALSETDRAEIIATAHAAADVAREVTLTYFRGTGLGTTSKKDAGFDPVTVADRGSEQAMRALIEARRPQDGIMGEEFGPKTGSSGLTWVLDPIDGTRGFISGTPTWGVLIALRDADEALFGIIDQPYIGERFLGGFGLSEMTGPHGTRVLGVRSGVALGDAVIFSTFPEVGSEVEGRAFHDLAARCKLTRYGMDCYAYALLAAGQIDLVVEAGLQSYDILGPLAVIEAAGGIVTDWQGGPALEGGRVVAAASKELHEAALAVLSTY